MTPMGDAIAVLGSRHGLLLDPAHREVRVLRYDRFDQLARCQLRAGIRVGTREVLLPLAEGGTGFSLLDQRSTPCTIELMGIDAPTGTKVTLTIAGPFRPRDADFSTTPALALRLDVERMPGSFRWDAPTDPATEVTAFLKVTGLDAAPHGEDAVDLRFISTRTEGGWGVPEVNVAVPQVDRLVAGPGTRRSGTAFERTVPLAVGRPGTLLVHWAACPADALQVHGALRPFRFRERFADLDAVTAWVRAQPQAILANAARVDALCRPATLDKPIQDLMAFTLHAWQVNTWWVQDWFSVWEGNCYFHSTVDVEFTQAPFYLAVWPELLAQQLKQWTAFTVPASTCPDLPAPRGTFLSHDCGAFAQAGAQRYPHHMPVEETANWLILLHAHHRRTGDDALVRAHAGVVRDFTAFLAACDVDGTGAPVRGVANTIDDGSPAIQYGESQVYLAVKTLAALVAAEACLRHVGDVATASDVHAHAARLRATIHAHGWAGTHFRTLLRPDGTITDPWTKERRHHAVIPGWDAPHIYTANALPVLDQVGTDLGLDDARLRQDLAFATAATLGEYGCFHTVRPDPTQVLETDAAMKRLGLAGASRGSGWVAMNLSRDLVAARRGVDLRHLAARYWNWQVTTNTHEVRLFFETFSGNNLSFYPRGLAVWGYPEALAGVVIDRVAGIRRTTPRPGTDLPLLAEADWAAGTAPRLIG